MSISPITANLPPVEALAQSYSEEARVRVCVTWLLRVLKPIDEPLFYHIVDEFLVDQSERVRLEVQSRIYQMIPISKSASPSFQNLAWYLD